MSHYTTLVSNLLYPHRVQRDKLEAIERNLRRNVYLNEITGLTSVQKNANRKDIVAKANSQLNDENIKGFNLWAFLIGLAGFHTGRIFQTKVLYYEMGKAWLPHTIICVGIGAGFGILVGQLFSYDMGVYARWRRAKKSAKHFEKI